ncbi:VirK/YbjX family protein [Enterobacteriaceae bacterium H4N4]|uniref:VirK/YbjX family protein n=1 Tax=Silvania confinis TaxID=2926470 RepID=A0A9J6QJ44_9ENTR|nr:VirK/YbjX family protein [Silvania confinis]MCU6670881.1 VirK/YbjX family protein [Silvania confinis]
MSQLTDHAFIPPRSMTRLGLFFNLFSGKWRPGEFWHRRSFRLKFLLRSLLMPRLSLAWMTELAQFPDLNELLIRQPRLPVRLHRPYLAVNLDRKQLLEAIRYHYSRLYDTLTPEELRGYLRGSELMLSQLEGKNGEKYTLELTMMITLDKEGESTILMRNEEGETLAEMTFTLCQYQNQATLFIGGLQGGKRELPHEEIQKATKACHGLFPKRLVMEAVCQFAARFGVTQILAVSNETHIYRSLRYRDKKEQIHADYSSFWETVGGECDTDGYFHIPGTVARKNEAEIASKKRAEYRRRHQLLDTIPAQMSGLFR